MKITLALVFSSLLGMSLCTPENDASLENWWIDGTTVSCVGVSPNNCLQVQKNEKIDPNAWELFYDHIEDFEAKPGVIYQVKVKVTPKAEPIPQDASSMHYKLIEVISKYSYDALKSNESWKVTKAFEIKNPTHSFTNEPLIFEFNLKQKTYSGDLGCNKIHGQITQNTASKLQFAVGISTKMACGDMATEHAISKGLGETRTYKIEKNRMTFFNQEGKIVLEFEKTK